MSITPINSSGIRAETVGSHDLEQNQKWPTVLACPSCKSPLETTDITKCFSCGFQIESIAGIPVLVNNKDLIDSKIAEARQSGLRSWYEERQAPVVEGPYRHHLRKRREYVGSVLKRYVDQHGKPGSGLDLGCGDGTNLPWLSQYVQTLFASDYNLIRLQRAAELPFPSVLFMADATDYPAVSNSLDVIFFNHVLEHIPNDMAALSEVYRILKPGGIVILGVPNEGALFWRLAYWLQPKSRLNSDHVHFYTADDLSEKCLSAGFKLQEIKHIGWGIPHWGLDERVRGYKWVDDLLEVTGSLFIQSQATSLYLVLAK